MKIFYGEWYEVTVGAGLDTGRKGEAMCPLQKYLSQLYVDVPGLYKPFDPKREALLREANGKFFSMFFQYLKEVPMTIAAELREEKFESMQRRRNKSRT
jgi:hypothetical protein